MHSQGSKRPSSRERRCCLGLIRPKMTAAISTHPHAQSISLFVFDVEGGFRAPVNFRGKGLHVNL